MSESKVNKVAIERNRHGFALMVKAAAATRSQPRVIVRAVASSVDNMTHVEKSEPVAFYSGSREEQRSRLRERAKTRALAKLRAATMAKASD